LVCYWPQYAALPGVDIVMLVLFARHRRAEQLLPHGTRLPEPGRAAAGVKGGVKLRLFLPAAVLLINSLADAGPPLTLEDPNILEPGQWEVILAGTYERRRSGQSGELPVLDVSLGLSENIQASAVLARAISNPRGDSSRSDFGMAEISVKWRFLATDTLQLAFAPLYEFPARSGATDRGVIEDERALVLPLVAEYAWPEWRVNTQLGYVAARGEPDGWTYAAALARPLGDRLEVMLELYGDSADGFDDRSLAWRLGFELGLREDINLLLAAGSGLSDADDDDLRFDVFLGLQWLW